MFLIKHLPALQVLLPFFAALFAAISFDKFVAWLITACAAFICFAISIYGINYVENLSYMFGDWQAPIGIEYRLDHLNQPLIVYINAVFLFFIILGKPLIDISISQYTTPKRQHLFYSLVLFAHAGYIGVISTNDLFNLYVFIEISSLASYVLISLGSNKRALIGAFDYLILGTIGATLILISIGFLLALTGSLNISDIAKILQDVRESRILITAIVFFLSGCILKIAFFPMHFWMIRAYNSAPPFILTYLAAIPSAIGIYLIMRFMYFTLNHYQVNLIQELITMILRPLALGTIVFCTLLALGAKNLKTTIIYSSASQIGYIFLLLSIPEAKSLMFQLIIIDGLNKVALFTLISYLENRFIINNIRERLFKLLGILILLFSAGLPLTSMFIAKIKIFDLLIAKSLYIEFIIIIIGTIFSLFYHLKMGKKLIFTNYSSFTGNVYVSNYYNLIAIVILQMMSLFYINKLTSLSNWAQINLT